MQWGLKIFKNIVSKSILKFLNKTAAHYTKRGKAQHDGMTRIDRLPMGKKYGNCFELWTFHDATGKTLTRS